MAEQNAVQQEQTPAPAAATAPAQADASQIKSLLNLPETASDLDVIQTMAAVIANLQEQYDALQADYVTLRGEDVKNRLAAFSDVITPASAPYWTEQFLANRDAATLALLDLRDTIANRAPDAAPAKTCPHCGQPVDETEDGYCNRCGKNKDGAMKNAAPAPEPLRNRIAGEVTKPLGDIVDGPAKDAAAATAIRNRAEQIIAQNPRLPWVDAFNQAEKEISK